MTGVTHVHAAHLPRACYSTLDLILKFGQGAQLLASFARSGMQCSPVTDQGTALTLNLPAVPKRLQRFYGNGDLHFTASCYQRQPLLGSARRRDLFLKVLEQVRQRYEFVVAGYVVTPEHFHLLISDRKRGTLPS